MDIDKIECCDFFTVETVDGVKYVDLIGYYYVAEDKEYADEGRNCRRIDQSIRMSVDRLKEVLASGMHIYDTPEARDRPLDEITDLTEEEMVARFNRDVMECAHMELDEVDQDTPDDLYVTGVSA